MTFGKAISKRTSYPQNKKPQKPVTLTCFVNNCLDFPRIHAFIFILGIKQIRIQRSINVGKGNKDIGPYLEILVCAIHFLAHYQLLERSSIISLQLITTCKTYKYRLSCQMA